MRNALSREAGPGRASWRRWLLLWLLVAMWGSAFGLVSLGLEELPTISLVGIRLWAGWLVLMPLLWVKGLRLPRDPTAWAYYFVIAVLGNCLPFFLITWGQQAVPSGAAGILMSVTPLIVVALAHFFLPGERATRTSLLGVLAGFAGIWLLMAPSLGASGSLGDPQLLGRELAVLAGALCYGITIVVARRQAGREPLVAAVCVLGIAALLMLGPAWTATSKTGWSNLSWTTLLVVLLLGPLCTGYATVVYFQLIDVAGATFLSLINYLIPVWAVAVGALFLGERLHWTAWVAMLVVLIGVALAGRSNRRAARHRPRDH
jgi:drug/metabolite transporter (DMT)-like permease